MNRRFQEHGPGRTAPKRNVQVTDQDQLKTEWSGMTALDKEHWLCIAAPELAKKKPGSYLNRPEGYPASDWDMLADE